LECGGLTPLLDPGNPRSLQARRCAASFENLRESAESADKFRDG